MNSWSVLFLIVSIVLAVLLFLTSIKWAREKRVLLKEKHRTDQLIGELRVSKAADEHTIEALRSRVDDLENRLREARL